ncbi:hypothetical protein K439DRAFT_1662257 [Ramaria rubella]|nr:hypothetical protein K439DRAFT_1662257 [Ramaria rubella]
MASLAGPSTKLVHDDSIASLSEISLSFLSSDVYEPTSTLQYVNSQLVAHGFARSPGISLDGLAVNDNERVVKCILALLSQRMEDLGRTEELGSKLRTLTYEYERLQSMHRTAVEGSANAEREMHFFKSKLATSQRSLALEVSAHKQTVAELQRTRTSLQYLRSTTQNELKRKEKEVERVLERWNKVLDSQAKLIGAQSGLQCVNYAVGVEEPLKGKGLMEEALEQAEEARGELLKENDGFRSVILGIANALQGVVYNLREQCSDSNVEEVTLLSFLDVAYMDLTLQPTPLSHTAVFAPPMSSLLHPDNAHAKIRELLSALQGAISVLSPSPFDNADGSDNEEEITKLRDLVKSLRTELDQSRQSSSTLATQTQKIIDRFSTHASERLVTGRDPTPEEAIEMSIELISAPERDELRERLDMRAKELASERARFTEAAVKLGQEKASLEKERLGLLEEKRRWAVEQMLAELPPTPVQDFDMIPPPPSKANVSPSPRARPRKASGSKVVLGSPSKRTITKRTSAALSHRQPDAPVLGKKLKARREGAAFEVLYDSESQQVGSGSSREEGLQRSTTPEDSPPVVTQITLAAEMRTSLPLVLPTTFTLPPPSPASSLTPLDLSLTASKVPGPSAPPVPSSIVPGFDRVPLATPAHLPISPMPRPHIFPSPRTPRPLVNTHMKHAYSPARPSPLSRILMIADSPPSPPSVPRIQEEDEKADSVDSDVEFSHKNSALGGFPRRNLALKLEVPVDEPSPLRERTGADLNGNVASALDNIGNVKGSLGNTGENRLTAKQKGKIRALPIVAEKENLVVLPQPSHPTKAKMVPPSTSGTINAKAKATRSVGSNPRNAVITATSNLKSLTGVPPKATLTSKSTRLQADATSSGAAPAVRLGGARRVPVGSANAGKLSARMG